MATSRSAQGLTSGSVLRASPWWYSGDYRLCQGLNQKQIFYKARSLIPVLPLQPPKESFWRQEFRCLSVAMRWWADYAQVLAYLGWGKKAEKVQLRLVALWIKSEVGTGWKTIGLSRGMVGEWKSGLNDVWKSVSGNGSTWLGYEVPTGYVSKL